MDAEEEALFRSYPYALYFVQSPSTASRANSAELRNNESTFHSPTRSEPFPVPRHPTRSENQSQEATRFTLSRYSSRGSNNSFGNLHDKKIIPYDAGTENDENHLTRGVEGCDDGWEEEEEDYFEGKGWWWRYLSFQTSSSLAWIGLQVCWRLFVSLGVALLVFYIATKPPRPQISVKMVGIRQFGLGEGVDSSGVTTKILTCNCSMDLVVENKSKLFGLHVHPPIMEMFYANFPLAISSGPKLYAGSDGSTSFRLYVATRNKPMYGAGRAMQDMLDMGKGLPLAIRMSSSSNYRVVWGLMKPKFHHKAECLLVLDRAFDQKHHTQVYNSSCIVTS
ncbi:hypothetical protein NMG60_11023381 [Bertholletia excelsa]